MGNPCYSEVHTVVNDKIMERLLNVSNTSILHLDIPGNEGFDHDSGGDELYEPPLAIVIILSLLYGGISVAALIGNLLVLWVVTVSRRMRTVTNFFIANLALGDIIIGLFAIPFQFQAALLQRWNLPEFLCAFCPFVQVLSVNISVFTLSAIAVDRYRAVMYPLYPRASKKKASWAILSIWLVGVILAIPTQLDYKVIQVMGKESSKPFCINLTLSSTFRTYYNLGLVVLQYFFPLIIITGAYAHMATKLWGATAPGNKQESRDAVVLRNKKKVIKMLALVVLLFALCWLPLQMYNFLQTLIPSINEYQYINIIWFCFHALAMSNSCYNPFIYAIYNDKFQREFRTRLWCFRNCRHSEGQGFNGMDLGGPNYSDGSDIIDRSKIRASYKFSNNRSGFTGITRSSICNQASFYGGSSSRFNIDNDSQRNSLRGHFNAQRTSLNCEVCNNSSESSEHCPYLELTDYRRNDEPEFPTHNSMENRSLAADVDDEFKNMRLSTMPSSPTRGRTQIASVIPFSNRTKTNGNKATTIKASQATIKL